MDNNVNNNTENNVNAENTSQEGLELAYYGLTTALDSTVFDELIIPETVDGKPVVALGKDAFCSYSLLYGAFMAVPPPCAVAGGAGAYGSLYSGEFRGGAVCGRLEPAGTDHRICAVFAGAILGRLGGCAGAGGRAHRPGRRPHYV